MTNRRFCCCLETNFTSTRRVGWGTACGQPGVKGEPRTGDLTCNGLERAFRMGFGGPPGPHFTLTALPSTALVCGNGLGGQRSQPPAAWTGHFWKFPVGASRCPAADDGDQGHHRGWVRWRRLREVVWEQQVTAEGRGAPPPPGLLPSRRPLGRQRGRLRGWCLAALVAPGLRRPTTGQGLMPRGGGGARSPRTAAGPGCAPHYGSSSGAAPAREASGASLRTQPPFPAPGHPGSC